MKKFLLTFFIAFMGVLSYAQVDTMYVILLTLNWS